MELPTHILLTYGYLLLFAWVLVEQFGIPLPATPILLAAGALTAHELSFPLVLAAALAATLIADSTWFLIGRKYGRFVLRFLCKMSMEPTICVRRTQDSLGRRRDVTLLVQVRAGTGDSGPAGSRTKRDELWAVLLFDGMEATLWVSVLLTLGRFFGDLLRRDPDLLDWAGPFSGALLVLGIPWLLCGPRRPPAHGAQEAGVAARLEPEELKKQLDAGEPVYIVDLRHPLELLPDPFTLPGAVHFSPDTLAARHLEIPRDRDIVLFCTCPSEATAAKTAMALHKLGIERVRPLRGGFDEWKRLGFPLDAIPLANPS